MFLYFFLFVSSLLCSPCAFPRLILALPWARARTHPRSAQARGADRSLEEVWWKYGGHFARHPPFFCQTDVAEVWRKSGGEVWWKIGGSFARLPPNFCQTVMAEVWQKSGREVWRKFGRSFTMFPHCRRSIPGEPKLQAPRGQDCTQIA